MKRISLVLFCVFCCALSGCATTDNKQTPSLNDFPQQHMPTDSAAAAESAARL